MTKGRAVMQTTTANTDITRPHLPPTRQRATPRTRLAAVAGRVPRGRRAAVVIALVMAGAYGAMMGVALPRGPVTTSQAVTTLGISVVVGLLAGIVMQSRW